MTTFLIISMVHLSFLLNIGMIIMVARKCGRSQVRTAFLCTLGIMIVWTASDALIFDALLAIDHIPMFFVDTSYIGVCFVPVAILYLGKAILHPEWHPRPIHALFFVVPLVSIVIICTNDMHHLFFVNFALYSSEVVTGVYFYIHSIYSYGCIAVGIVLMIIASARNSGLFSRQSLFVILGIVITLIPNILYSFGVVDLIFCATSATFAITLLCFSVAFLKYRFITALPITLRQVVDLISDGYLVVDKQLCILNYNRALLHMFPEQIDITLGVGLRSFIDKYFIDPSYDQFLELQARAIAEHGTVSTEGHIIGDTYVSMEVTQVMQRNTQIGSIILLKDITQSVRLIEATKAASRAKTEFLSNMSHEIRTPMNAILGITEIQLQSESLSQNEREAFSKIYISGDMLLGIINDILDLSKIEAGKLELVLSNYEIASLISDTAQLNMMRIGSKQIEFRLHVDENVPSVLMGDELRIKQILNNILSNAFKYTEKGMVELSVSSEAMDGKDNRKMLIFAVSDTGQGMTTEQIERIFDEFTRFNMETNRTTEGTGLGMSITRNLIRLMDGEIYVDSEPEKGSVFTVRIPQSIVGSGVLGKELAENLQQFQVSSKAHMQRVQITREPMPYGYVLIVDDVETNIYVARGLLIPYGLKVDSVESGYAAIDRVKQGEAYDIIFMDHMMPKMDGIEATNIIRSMGYDRPIVALTANAVSGQAELFLTNGFDDFISKPIDIRQLNTILNKLIRDKQPPEVIEAARQQAEAKTEQPANGEARTSPDPRFAAIFLRDAIKAIAVLDSVYKKKDDPGEDDLRTFVINAHGIKSALANIGEPELSALALGLEEAGRAGNIDVIRTDTPRFLRLLQELTEKLKPEAEEPDAEPVVEDQQYLQEKLLSVRAACDAFDKKLAKILMVQMREKKWSKINRELLETIDEHLLHSDFDEVAVVIDNFLKTK